MGILTVPEGPDPTARDVIYTDGPAKGFQADAFGASSDLNWVQIGAMGSTSSSAATSSFLAGGQLGYNYQFAPSWVIGVDTDLQGLTGGDKKTTQTAVATTTQTAVAGDGIKTLSTMNLVSRNLDYLGTLRARVGYLMTQEVLAYATGGLAYGQVGLNGVTATGRVFPGDIVYDGCTPLGCAYASSLADRNMNIGGGSYSEMRIGWTVGGGFEWAFSPNWSVKGEYLYYNFGNLSAEYPVSSSSSSKTAVTASSDLASSRVFSRLDGHLARIGLNYHLNWGNAAIASTDEDKATEEEKAKDTSYFWKPIVSKLEFSGGALDSGSPIRNWGGQGSVVGAIVTPIDRYRGLQLDVLAGGEHNSFVPIVGAHYFWADPKNLSLGLYGEAGYASGVNGAEGNLKLAVENSVFFNDHFTTTAVVGLETDGYRSQGPKYNCAGLGNAGCYLSFTPGQGWGVYDGFGNQQPNVGRTLFDRPNFYDHLELAYYPLQDLKLTIAHEHIEGFHQGIAGAEYLLRTGNGIAPAVFAEAGFGERGYRSFLAGVRFYFGEEGDKSALGRHREDDPATLLRRTLAAFGGHAGSRDDDRAQHAGVITCSAGANTYTGPYGVWPLYTCQ